MKLAVQVLSRSVAIALQESGADDVLETAKFCMMINDFFDCTNVRSKTEHVSKRNHLLKPYTSQDDERFSWLKDVFLEYLNDWKDSTTAREGKYSSKDREKMFISTQTYEGFKISVHSHTQSVMYLCIRERNRSKLFTNRWSVCIRSSINIFKNECYELSSVVKSYLI